MKKIKRLSELENYTVPEGISKYIDILPVVDHFYLEEITDETINKCVVEGPLHLLGEKKNRQTKEDFEDLECPCILVKTYPFEELARLSHRHPQTGAYGSFSTIDKTKALEDLLKKTRRLGDDLIFKVGRYRNSWYVYDVKVLTFSDHLVYKPFFIDYPLTRLSYDINKIVVMGAFYKLVEDFYEGHFNFEDKTAYYKNQLMFKYMDVEGMLLIKDPDLKKWEWLLQWIEGEGEINSTFTKRVEEIQTMYEVDEEHLIENIEHLKEGLASLPLSIILVDRIIDYMNKVMHYVFVYLLLYKIERAPLNTILKDRNLDINMNSKALGNLSPYNPEYFVYSLDYLSFEYYSEFANRFSHFLEKPFEYSSLKHNVSKVNLDQWIKGIEKARPETIMDVDISRADKRRIENIQESLLPRRVNLEKWLFYYNTLASLLKDTLERCGEHQGIENLYDMRLENLEKTRIEHSKSHD